MSCQVSEASDGRRTLTLTEQVVSGLTTIPRGRNMTAHRASVVLAGVGLALMLVTAGCFPATPTATTERIDVTAARAEITQNYSVDIPAVFSGGIVTKTIDPGVGGNLYVGRFDAPRSNDTTTARLAVQLAATPTTASCGELSESWQDAGQLQCPLAATAQLAQLVKAHSEVRMAVVQEPRWTRLNVRT